MTVNKWQFRGYFSPNFCCTREVEFNKTWNLFKYRLQVMSFCFSFDRQKTLLGVRSHLHPSLCLPGLNKIHTNSVLSPYFTNFYHAVAVLAKRGNCEIIMREMMKREVKFLKYGSLWVMMMDSDYWIEELYGTVKCKNRGIRTMDEICLG
jgi:hypothetical protein